MRLKNENQLFMDIFPIGMYSIKHDSKFQNEFWKPNSMRLFSLDYEIIWIDENWKRNPKFSYCRNTL